MVMYISLIELVKAEAMFPRVMRKPPIITTGRLPKRLLNIVDKGAEGRFKRQKSNFITQFQLSQILFE